MCAAKKRNQDSFGMGKFVDKEPRKGAPNAGYEFAPEIVPAGDGLVTSRKTNGTGPVTTKQAGESDGV